jgi:hypothetical protein
MIAWDMTRWWSPGGTSARGKTLSGAGKAKAVGDQIEAEVDEAGVSEP